MVDQLGPEGMSSDDSGDEGFKSRVFTVRSREWRSAYLLKLLRFLDEHHDGLNCNGNRSPGAQPHQRARLGRPPVSVRQAIARLPRNFYSDVWYDLLTPSQQAQLQAGPVMVLPILPSDY